MQVVLDKGLTAKIEKATAIIRRFNGAVVALSAGVDSSLVAVLAKRALDQRVIAVTGVSESLGRDELAVAQRTAGEVGIRHLVVQTSEMQNQDYVSNMGDRCYHCKKTLYGELRNIAVEMGYEAILDGTQLDDMNDHRPGLRAGTEANVSSPLLEAGFTKQEVRTAARELGLSVWNKPAMPCLSSRVPVGQAVTTEKLRMIDEAESYIRTVIKVKDLRVRHSDGSARIEVGSDERCLFFNERLMNLIDSELRRIGFSSVSLDLKGYKKPGAEPHSLILPIANDH